MFYIPSDIGKKSVNFERDKAASLIILFRMKLSREKCQYCDVKLSMGVRRGGGEGISPKNSNSTGIFRF